VKTLSLNCLFQHLLHSFKSALISSFLSCFVIVIVSFFFVVCLVVCPLRRANGRCRLFFPSPRKNELHHIVQVFFQALVPLTRGGPSSRNPLSYCHPTTPSVFCVFCVCSVCVSVDRIGTRGELKTVFLVDSKKIQLNHRRTRYHMHPLQMTFYGIFPSQCVSKNTPCTHLFQHVPMQETFFPLNEEDQTICYLNVFIDCSSSVVVVVRFQSPKWRKAFAGMISNDEVRNLVYDAFWWFWMVYMECVVHPVIMVRDGQDIFAQDGKEGQGKDAKHHMEKPQRDEKTRLIHLRNTLRLLFDRMSKSYVQVFLSHTALSRDEMFSV
jgi:hypothetical protein